MTKQRPTALGCLAPLRAAPCGSRCRRATSGVIADHLNLVSFVKVLTDSRKLRHIGEVASTPSHEEQLRMAGLRVTRPRVAVLDAVCVHPHADTETIFGAVRVGLPDVSRQAVYDVLHALTAKGLVRRIQPSGSVARYEARVGDNHHHVVCRSCGAIADVDCAVGDVPCLTASDDHGFHLDEAEVIYWGLCPDCSTSRSQP